MWKSRSKMLFASAFILALFVWTQMGLYAAHILLGGELQFNVFEVCGSLLKALGFDSVTPLLSALVAYTFGCSLWIWARQVYLSRRTYRKLLASRHDGSTEELNARFSADKPDLLVVTCAEPIALTLGLLRPKIILSTGMLQLLDRQELEAVVYHELYHRHHRDPLKTFLLHLACSVMRYIPILRWCYQHYKITREILADREAIRVMGSPASLASALLKLVRKRERTASMEFAYVSFADTSINYRIRQILDPRGMPALGLPVKLTIVSLPVVLSLSVLFFLSLL